jgi:hypothetical protein
MNRGARPASFLPDKKAKSEFGEDPGPGDPLVSGAPGEKPGRASRFVFARQKAKSEFGEDPGPGDPLVSGAPGERGAGQMHR